MGRNRLLLLLAILVASCLFDGYYVTAWKTCVLPSKDHESAKDSVTDNSKLLYCNDLDKNGIIEALTRHNLLLVKGVVSPRDLSPLSVESLEKGIFLVKAPRRSRSARYRRSVTNNPGGHAEPQDEEPNTFVVSTFAFNPKLLRNASHSQRYSVFAKLTEGVLQEHYKKYGSKEPPQWNDVNNQIYTEDLFNNIVAATGPLGGGSSSHASLRSQEGKTFGQIVNEFQSRMLADEAREEKPKEEEKPCPWPKSNLHPDRENSLLEKSGGVLRVDDRHYLVSNDEVLRRIVSSNILFDNMQPRIILMPSVIAEDGNASSKFKGFRMLTLFTPRVGGDQPNSDERLRDTNEAGTEALRKAALLLSGLNGKDKPYPVS